MHLYEHDPRANLKKGRARNERWQQRLMRSENKLIILSAAASIVRPVIVRNDISTSRILLKSTNQVTACANGLGPATVSIKEDNIPPVEWAQKRQRLPFSVRATKPSMKLI